MSSIAILIMLLIIFMAYYLAALEIEETEKNNNFKKFNDGYTKRLQD